MKNHRVPTHSCVSGKVLLAVILFSSVLVAQTADEESSQGVTTGPAKATADAVPDESDQLHVETERTFDERIALTNVGIDTIVQYKNSQPISEDSFLLSE